VSYL